MLLNLYNMGTGLIIGTLSAKYRGIAAGGIATHIEGLINSLHKKRILTYICYHKPFGVKHAEVIGSSKTAWTLAVLKGLFLLSFIRAHHWGKYSFKTNLFIAYYYATLRCLFKRMSPDFIHVHSLYNPAPIALRYLKYQKNIIVTDHGFWLSPDYMNDRKSYLLQENFAIATKVVYISDVAFRKHEQAKLGDLKKLVKISNPTSFMNYPLRDGSALKRDKYVLIFNGYKESLTTKGLEFLVNAINGDGYLCDNLRLLIICNDEASNYLMHRKWNFEYQVFGRTKFEDILNMYVRSDILVVPSRSESFGLVYTEALAVGIPIVGYHEIVEELQRTLGQYIGAGIDISNEQHADLVRKIKDVLHHPFDRNAVRKSLEANYEWENAIERFLRLYHLGK